jgi:hypothetical protein
MARKGWYRAVAAGVSLCGIVFGSARASGPGEPAPHYVDQFGGDRADLKQVWEGRIGVVMARAPRSELYMKWRLLHGWAVGAEAGAALSTPCCDARPANAWPPTSGSPAWIEARKLVAGAPPLARVWIDPERQGADGVSTPNCFDDAFDFATRTLKDRIRDHGAADPAVRAWLATQDAVFTACSDPAAQLPPFPADAPAWLKADRAYQEAAFALYQGRYEEAAGRFRPLIGNRASPYQNGAAYLVARALWRNALAHPSPGAETEARQAIDRLAALPPTPTYGRSQIQPMRESMEVRLHPEIARPRLERALASPETSPRLAVEFRDLSDISDDAVAHGGRPSEVLDWIATMKGAVPKPPQKPAPVHLEPKSNDASTDPATQMARMQAARVRRQAEDAKRQEADRREAFLHAAGLWNAGHDPAWLLAALSLANPEDREVAALSAAAEKTDTASPGWLTLQHHLIRLTRTTRPAAEVRARLDSLLARQDLSNSDRNLFLAARAQVAADLDDFLAHAVRKQICPNGNSGGSCPRDDWPTDSYQSGGVFDGGGPDGPHGLGDDARAVLDRMPLALRMRAGRDARLAPSLRLDLALTNFARAVDLQDGAAIDMLSGELETLLPPMAPDFAAVRKAQPGADKRFAEFFVLAKIPGLRTDLVEYTRPEGATVNDYGGSWADWIVLARGHPLAASAPPEPALYQQDGQGAAEDLTCLGECQIGAEPLRLPDFVAKTQADARGERGYFLRPDATYYLSGQTNPAMTLPPGGVSAWEEMLTYIAAHPDDARAPEALYWLVHVGHFGGSHAHSGRRAFKLLKSRYGSSPWAAKVKYYYD